MNVIFRSRYEAEAEAEADEIIATVKKVTRELIRDKEKGRQFLIKYGFITKTGRLTKRYGG